MISIFLEPICNFLKEVIKLLELSYSNEYIYIFMYK
jgi:hypothetical protein